jgi:hypothetical protein
MEIPLSSMELQRVKILILNRAFNYYVCGGYIFRVTVNLIKLLKKR